MSPLELITQARRVGRYQHEISLRDAVSRAYYGAFHFAGEKLEQLTSDSLDPFRWTGRRKNHKGLRDEWRERLGDTGQAIANALFDAHEIRKKADYDLHLVFTAQDKEHAFRFVARAIWLIRSAKL